MFVGIEFHETVSGGGSVALVNKKWLTPRKHEVFWPPYKQQDAFDKALKRGTSPGDNWSLYQISRIFFEEDDYKKALTKTKRAEVVSEFNSDEEEVLPAKRKVKRKCLSFSDDEGELHLRYPLPPKIQGIESLEATPNSSFVVSKGSKTKDSFADFPANILAAEPTNIEIISVNKPPQTPHQFEEHHQGTQQNSQTRNTLLCNPEINIKNPHQFEEHYHVTPRGTLKGTQNRSTPLCCQEYNKKLLHLLVQIKLQNQEILTILQQKTSPNGHKLQLPNDIPVKLPLSSLNDLRKFEEYLDDKRLSDIGSYFATIGGRNLTSKTNTILKLLLTNQVACEYSWLGSRNNKKSFQELKLGKIVTDAVLSTCTEGSENMVETAVKVWLKHAPTRLSKLVKK